MRALLLVIMLITTSTYASPVKIIVPVNGASYRGSGVYVESDGQAAYVYTNAHVVRDNTGTFIVKTPPCLFYPLGERFQGSVIYKNEAIDVAVIRIAIPKSVKPTPIAEADIPLGTEIYTWSSSPRWQGRTVIHRGKSLRYYNKGYTTELSFLVVDGDSGSPVLSNQKVVGLIYANDGDANGDGRPDTNTSLMTNWSALKLAQDHIRNTKQWCEDGNCWQGVGGNQYQGQPIYQQQPQQEIEEFDASAVDYSKDFEALKTDTATFKTQISDLDIKVANVATELDNTKKVIDTNATTANKNNLATKTALEGVNNALVATKTEIVSTVNQANQKAQESILTKVSDKLEAVKTGLENKYDSLDQKYTYVKTKVSAVADTVNKIQESRGIINTITIMKASGIPLGGIALIMCAYGGYKYLSNKRQRVGEYYQGNQYQPEPTYRGGGGVIYQQSYQPVPEPPPREPPPRVPEPPIIIPTQVKVPNNQYIPFETNDYRLAVQEAQKQAAKQYPGSTGVLEYVDSLVQQYMNARSNNARN
jgi:hypothetical protein